jgi:hypothetical protein
MKREFVPYELALRMKEIGFDEPCLAFWDAYNGDTHLFFEQRGNYHWLLRLFNKKPKPILEITNHEIEHLEGDCTVLAPTFSQAFRWFREHYRIITEIRFYNNGEEWEETEFTVTINRFEDFATHNTFVKSDIKTYEDAELICLDKLIQIVELGKKWDELYNSGLDEPLKEW